MKLTQPQVNAYERDGYHLPGRLISDVEADRMGQVYLNCLENYQSGHATQGVRQIHHSKDGPGLYQLRCAHLMDPGFDAIMRSPDLLDAVESIIGPNIQVIICQGLYKPPHTGEEIKWHQDDFYFRVDKPNAVVSCWLTFDDATVESGCMWVIPGAHKATVDHNTVPSGTGFYMESADEESGVAVELPRGHYMLHHGLMPHRTLAIHYMDASASPSESRRQEPPENSPIVRGHGV